MPLTGKQVQALRDALLDAYGDADELRMMVRIELDENLDAIAGGSNLRILIFNLVTWAERAGQVAALLDGAARHNAGNPALQQLVQAWRPAPSSSAAGWYEAWIGTPGVDARMVWAEFSADDLFNHIVHTEAYEHGWYEYHELPIDDTGEFVESVVKYAWRSTFDFFHFMEPDWYIYAIDDDGDVVMFPAPQTSDAVLAGAPAPVYAGEEIPR